MAAPQHPQSLQDSLYLSHQSLTSHLAPSASRAPHYPGSISVPLQPDQPSQVCHVLGPRLQVPHSLALGPNPQQRLCSREDSR